MIEVVLPNLGFGMEEGRLIAWLKQPGVTLRKGEAIAEIESDKTNVELEAVADGVLDEILVAADTVVPVGTVLARIRPAGSGEISPPVPAPKVEQISTAPIADIQASPLARRMAQEHGIDLDKVQGTGREGRILREDIEALIASRSNGSALKPLAAPATRKLAQDYGIDLSQIRGTGREGRITRADVEARLSAASTLASADSVPSATAQPVATVSGERTEVALSQMRKTIARRLSQSMQETPHFYVSGELDFTDALKTLPKEIGLNNLLLYLTVKALKDVPELNATFEEGHLYHYPQVNLAMAVALPNGLLTPVLRGADDFSLSGLASRARDLVSRAREGRLKPDDLQGGTFTISNLGVVKQIDHFTAIINPPQVGILAIGAVKERSLVMNGGLHIRTTAYLTVSADHRIVDGLVSARFIEAFDKHLQAFTP
jgi:pyruvate dehydrogenase E2 component (dihydrolipoamide acetyltransferase)